jgi:hypothetical protein
MPRPFLGTFAVALAIAFKLGCATNVFTSTRQLSTTEYDFVIIGGGTAVHLDLTG